MSKTTSNSFDDKKDYQEEIDKLKKEIDNITSKSEIATLEAKIDKLKEQKENAQVPSNQSLTDLPGYDEELARLKQDAVKQLKKAKGLKIRTALTSIISIPISAFIVYLLFTYTGVIAFLELDANTIQIIYWVVAGIFIALEVKSILEFVRSLFINPEVIPEETLSYLSLTAKEHVLDPKGSVIREKYGTDKWSSVTHT
jgi:hypothetical protein